MVYFVQNFFLNESKTERLMIFFKWNTRNLIKPHTGKIAVDIDINRRTVKGWLQYNFPLREFVPSKEVISSKKFAKTFPGLFDGFGVFAYYFSNGKLVRLLQGPRELRKFSISEHGGFVYEYFKSAEVYKVTLLNKIPDKKIPLDIFENDADYEHAEGI